jgi:hypothetical protein
MKYDEHADLKTLWLQLAMEVMRKHGKVYAIGLLVGILAKHSHGDYEMKRELYQRLEKL